jgi:predicted secreted protein
MKDLEKLIDEVNGSMSMEGMPLTKTDKDRIRRCAGNDKLVEKTIAELVKKHTIVREYSHEQRL